MNSSPIKSWIIWAICASFVFYQFLVQVSPSIMVFHLQELLHRSSDSIALLSSSFFYTYLIAQLPAGIMVDLFGTKRVFIISILLLGIAVFVFAISYSFYTLLLARFFMGLFCASAVAGTMYIAANWFTPKVFALAAGLTEMLGMIGGALGQVYLSKISMMIGYDKSMLYCSFIAVLLLILVLLFVFDKPERMFVDINYENVNIKSFISYFLVVIKSWQSWINGLVAGVLFLPVGVFAGLWAIPFFQARYSMGEVDAAFLSSLVFWGSAVGCPFFGWLCEKVHSTKKLIYYICSAASLILMMSIITFSTLSVGVIAALLLLTGFVSGGYVVAFVIAKEGFESKYKGSILAFTNMAILLGALFLQPLVSFIMGFYMQGTKITGYAIAHGLTIIPILTVVSIFLIPFIKVKPNCYSEK